MNKKLLCILGASLLLGACSSSVQSSGMDQKVEVAKVEESSRTILSSIRSELVPAPRLVLETNQPPAYTSYKPQEDVFVVDLPRVTRASDLEIPTNLPSNVASISAEEMVEFGAPVTRITVRFSASADPSVQMADGDLIIGLDSRTGAIARAPVELPFEPEATVIVEEVPTVMATFEATESIPVLDEPVAEPVTMARTRRVSAPPPVVVVRDNPATSLRGIDFAEGNINILTDGRTTHSSFELDNPRRIVVDLPGLVNRSERRAFETFDSRVNKVRVAQFKSDPDPVARVVVDLDAKTDYRIRHTSRGLEVVLGSDVPEVVTISESLVENVEEVPTVVAYEAPRRVTPREEVAAMDATHVVYAPAIQQEMVPPVIKPVDTSHRSIRSTVDAEPVEDVFGEPMVTQSRPVVGAAMQGGSVRQPGESRRVGGTDRVYTGEPISLTLTNADIIDVLRLFSELTELNMAIDPEVAGTVTVNFTDVPWDQALELILRQNDLNYTLSGNVMRIGTINRLTDEARRTRELEEEERNNVSLQTVIKYLSYARAGEVASLLGELATPRGSLLVDERTNQLIISEVPDVLDTMFRLIETIDIATPQVLIEARIVETTKTFAQQLGVTWGFGGQLDPALGTGTGLTFPNTVGITGGPFDFGAGNPVLDFSFSDVLGTFNLDLTLTAAENEGLVKVVSAPRVMTEDNHAAEIQSGVQIPVQTRVNFTTTVTYIDATLRLTVTPQVTAEGTVIMDIQVQKTEPAAGLSVIGGGNIPLITRRAQTKLMVRDGGTTVIGGIYQASDNDSQTRVPFLHNIPVLGNLFKNHDVNSRHDELLIFITPRIIRNP